MAKADPKLMQFVEAEMEKDPDISSKALWEKAKEKMAAARDLTVREFHARYPLQVKRKASLAGGGGRKRRRSRKSRKRSNDTGAATARRDAVRTALLKFATDLSAAEDRKDLVRVLAQVDDYVEEVLKAAGG